MPILKHHWRKYYWHPKILVWRQKTTANYRCEEPGVGGTVPVFSAVILPATFSLLVFLPPLLTYFTYDQVRPIDGDMADVPIVTMCVSRMYYYLFLPEWHTLT
jgi:hypothetical protein